MRQNPAPDVAAEVRAQLGRLNRDGTWLASKLGVSEMWVSRRLRGITKFSVDDLVAVAAVLDVQAADLIPSKAPAVAA